MHPRSRIRLLAGLVLLLLPIAPGTALGATGDIQSYVGGPSTLSILNKDDLYYPLGIATDKTGAVYIADTYNNRIQMVSGTVVTTVAGSGVSGFEGQDVTVTAIDAEISHPEGLAVDALGTCMWPIRTTIGFGE